MELPVYEHDIPDSWDKEKPEEEHKRDIEKQHERRVSEVITRMPFLWLDIPDAPSKDSLRGYIERNSIALLSNYKKNPLDPPSADWLGHKCNRDRVKCSGLWNQNHVDETFDPDFLAVLDGLVTRTRGECA